MFLSGWNQSKVPRNLNTNLRKKVTLKTAKNRYNHN